MKIRLRKNLGQHFLKDSATAQRVAESLSDMEVDSVLEIGPGTGILTSFLLKRGFRDFRVVEIDNASVEYLRKNLPGLRNIIAGDFLKLDLDALFQGSMAIIGNFPYHISAPILFRVLHYRNKIRELTGMFQHEVAQRICAGPGSKTYGIMSVLIQAYYTTEYLFTVPEHFFSPPPKVKSGVIRLKRNNTRNLDCDEELFFKVVKASFNQRRKILRNSIRASFSLASEDNILFHQRPEQLSVKQFVELTRWISENIISE
ncbi:MAG: 16S rRNA (adenine(1518)-N(6)/adenine(1519)-N(6))-dimethyltransferase RsmA [Bacteroidales bacterium]